MELWRVRKEYRQVAARLRRLRAVGDPHLEALQEQVLVAIASCDRFETEAAVLRLARRATRARLGRLRRWVEDSTVLREGPCHLLRKEDEAAAQVLDRALARRGLDQLASTLRQALEELAHLDRRSAEVRARMERITATAAEGLRALVAWARARPALLAAAHATALEPPGGGG